MTSASDDSQAHSYPDEGASLLTDVPPPTYDMVLDWMKTAPGRAVSFDIWARGNYLRRVIHGRARRDPHLIVPVRYVDEMRWAYRRLALMGLPVDFLFVGGVTKTQKVLHLYPADGVVNEGGWGYIGALGSIAKIRGRRWFPVIGYSRLMPEPVLDWITDDASEAFRRGNVFVAPAELVGIDPTAPEVGSQALADVTMGSRLESSVKAATVLMELELPYLEGMRPSEFELFLKEHEEELFCFRSALRKLVGGTASIDIEGTVEELQNKVAELSRSAKHQAFRRNVSTLGGTLITFVAALGTTAAANPETLPAVTGVAVAAGATATLVDLWKQRTEHAAKLAENPFCLLWQLGVTKPSHLQRLPLNVSFRKMQRRVTVKDTGLFDCHWLCPPTPGLRFGAARRHQ